MVNETKYEKVNSNNIRIWYRDLELTNKQDLQDLKTDWNYIANLSDAILEKLGLLGLTSDAKTYAQDKVAEIDVLLDLFNNSTTSEEIDFLDEE